MKKYSLLLLIILFSAGVYAQNNTQAEITDIKNEIKELKNQQNKIVELLEIKNAKNNYESKIEEVKEIVKENGEREDRFLSIIMWIIGVVAVIIGFFLGGSLYEFRISKNKLKKELIEKATAEINNIVSQEKAHIQTMVENKVWEFELMGKSNIMVINPEKQGDSKYLPKILKWFEQKGGKLKTALISFDKTDNIIQYISENKDPDRFNIVLLENSDGDWKLDDNKEQAISIAAGLPNDVMLVYFGPKSAGFFPTDETDYKGYDNPKEIINKISFANAPSKLYPNLIDALKYMDIIKD